MKKLLFLFLFPLTLFAQNKAIQFSSNYVVVYDSTTKYLEAYGQSFGHYNYAMFKDNVSYVRLFDNYDGAIFVFSDTLVSGDFSQISTTGVFKLTVHSSPVSTTKRDILINDELLSYNTSTQTLVTPSTYGEPLKIINTSTQKVSVTIYMNGVRIWDVLPTNFSVLGNGIKKIIVP